MSFQNQGFWTAKGNTGVSDGELVYDNSSRVEPKRAHQCFMDGPETEFNPNKRQAVDGPSNTMLSGVLNSSASSWENGPTFPSMAGPFTERIFDSEASRAANFVDRNMLSGQEKTHTGRMAVENPLANDASFGLSISHSVEEPMQGINFGGIRKVKVSEVKDSETAMPISLGQAYSRVDMPAFQAYSRVDESAIPMGITYSKGVDSILTMGDGFVREENNFISIGQSYNREDDNLSITQAYKGDDSSVQLPHTFSKSNSALAMGENVDNTISMGQIYNKGLDSTVTMRHSYNKDDNNNLSMGSTFGKGDSSTIISFGSYDDDDDADPSGRLVCSYDLLMGQPLPQKSHVTIEKDSIRTNAEALPNKVQINASGENLGKKEEVKSSKKVPLNNFPSNVRSLLSTGIFDGVPVKYTAWSREKELLGEIRGSGYLCGCESCNNSKVINAYEFERHAGCKTKHPNNHIYFNNGKTIYGIVQELRSTPQDMLFDVIQTITGSPINQKSFRIWKESFLLATRELQRIYGKDEVKQLQ